MSLTTTPKTRLISIANIALAKSTITVIGWGTQLVKSLGDELLDVGWFIITLKSAYSQKWWRNAWGLPLVQRKSVGKGGCRAGEEREARQAIGWPCG
jgi:hypothetical protein